MDSPTTTGGQPRGEGPLPDGINAPGGVAVDPAAPIPVPDTVAMVGTDLDGTLLDRALQVGTRALTAIPRLAEQGVELVYVTGRPARWLPPIIDQTGHRGIAVCANGAMVVDLAEERLLRSTTIDPDLVLEAAERLRAQLPGVTFAVERLCDGAHEAHDLMGLTVVGIEADYEPPWGRAPGTQIGPIAELVAAGPVIKLLAAPPPDSDLDADALVTLAEADFGSRLHITHSGTRAVLIEVMAGEIDKGIGFLEVAELRGVDRQHTVAVGDMPNDVALIRAAGTGYAVANGHPAARAAADHIIPSNNDDGVGLLLEAILVVRR